MKKFELIAVGESPINYNPLQVSQSIHLAKLFKDIWPVGKMYKETFMLCAFNQNAEYMGYTIISEGGCSRTIVDVKLIFSFLLQLPGCSCFAVAHNHPSNNVFPSKADEIITDKINKSAELMDYKLLDHLIISEQGYYSFADCGQL